MPRLGYIQAGDVTGEGYKDHETGGWGGGVVAGVTGVEVAES